MMTPIIKQDMRLFPCAPQTKKKSSNNSKGKSNNKLRATSVGVLYEKKKDQNRLKHQTENNKSSSVEHLTSDQLLQQRRTSRQLSGTSGFSPLLPDITENPESYADFGGVRRGTPVGSGSTASSQRTVTPKSCSTLDNSQSALGDETDEPINVRFGADSTNEQSTPPGSAKGHDSAEKQHHSILGMFKRTLGISKHKDQDHKGQNIKQQRRGSSS